MSKKKYIDIYPTIYRVDLVVANEAVTLKDLQKKYTYVDGTELDENITADCIASTSTCRDKETGKYIILVKYVADTKVKGIDKKLDLLDTAAHEATHVIMHIYDFIGEKVFCADSNELLANHIGWATKSIYKTWTKK